MKRLLLLLAAFAAVSARAELVIAEKGGSPYQIVVPESSGNKRLDHFVRLGGSVLRTALRKAAGAEAPLVSESKKLANRPAIFVGSTEALRKAGLSSRDFAPWEYAIAVRGKDIYIYGRDCPAPLKEVPSRYLYYSVGSLKGCCTFAEKFLNTRFVGPVMNSDRENDGVRTLPLAKITVPDDFSFRRKPRFTLQGDNGGMLYAAANNFTAGTGNRFDVHYIDKVIPVAKYAKSHPEYFAVINGKRYLRADMPQYCMSNPEVQRIVFEDALKRADRGYPVVELGQQDGFIGCECAKCKAWYGTPDWGEKMWLFQRDTMAKLLKARPGIQVGIACYGVTHCVPKSFKRFPGKGVFIDIAPARKDLLEKWKQFNVVGMNAWAYSMGSYLACGYSPADSFEKLRREVKILRNTPVTSLYLCGYMTSFALNGPWLYAWGKFMDDPDADTKVLLGDYCRFAFGEKAAPGFIRFFSIIDEQMKKFPLVPGQDFNDVDGRKPRQSALKLWQNRYPPQVLRELCRLFDESVKLCAPDNGMLPRLKVEFEYMRLSAAVCNAIAAMDRNNTPENRRRLADALERRNAFIEALPERKRDGWIPVGFQSATKAGLRKGGPMAGTFGGAFNSDPKLLRVNAPETAAVKVRSFDDPAWEKAPLLKPVPLKNTFPLLPVSFRIGYTDKALLLKLEAPANGVPEPAPVPRDDLRIWRNSTWEIFIASGESRRQFAFNAVPGSAFDAWISSADVYFRKWQGPWTHRDKIENGLWRSQVTIPFACCGRSFEEGMRLQMQFAFSTPGAKAIYAWHIPLSGALADLNGYGGVRFGPRPATKESDLNGIFALLDKQKNPLFWKAGNLKMELQGAGKGNAVRLSGKIDRSGGFHSTKRIFVEPDEELEVTVRARGKGEIALAGQWRSNAGKWVENEGSRRLPLTEKTASFRHVFTPGHRVQKGAAHVTLSVYLCPPGGEMVIESVTARLRKRGGVVNISQTETEKRSFL